MRHKTLPSDSWGKSAKSSSPGAASFSWKPTARRVSECVRDDFNGSGLNKQYWVEAETGNFLPFKLEIRRPFPRGSWYGSFPILQGAARSRL